MPVIHQLAALALDPLVESAVQALTQVGGERSAAAVAAFLGRHFLDQSKRLPAALQRASAAAWKAVEVSLAGESLWNWLDRAEDRAFREQVRAFLKSAPLDNLPGDGKAFRRECLRQLRAARKAGLFDGALDPAELAKSVGGLARFSDPTDLLEAEWQAVAAIAEECRQAGHGALAQLVELRTDPKGTGLLVAGVRYFFRRELETDPELFRGLAWARLGALEGRQDEGFARLAEALDKHGDLIEDMLQALLDVVVETRGVVLDIRKEVLDLARRFDLLHRELRPRDSLSIGSEAERQLVKQVIARYRGLPEDERHRLPDLLNAVGKLEAAAGYFDAAREDFQEAARLGGDEAARAEAHYNAYGAALEQGNWPAALDSLRQAVALDAGRFAPFPLAKYEPERILGAGGFGVAFLCRNRHSGSRVVVKALHRDALEREVADVFREAHILEELEHPAVIRLRDCDFADAGQTRPYLVMDYFDGLTLAEHVGKHGPLGPEHLLAVLRPVAEALHAAHARGILHRDVKPANLLVRPGGEAGPWRVKLIDFGLALKQEMLRATPGGASPRTVVGHSIAGTVDYAAPEQLGRLPGVAVGPATDVYGFGKTCCFALFRTTQPLRKHWREIPEALADLLEQCLCEEPRERLAGFDQVLDRLDAVTSRPPEPPPPPPPPRPAPPGGREREWWRAAVPGAEATLGGSPGEVGRLRGHDGGVLCVAFSPAGGERLLSGGTDGTVRLWDTMKGKELVCVQAGAGKVLSVLFLGHHRFAMSAGEDRAVRYWDLEKAMEVRTLPDRSNRALAVSPDCRLALSGSVADGMVRLWEVSTGRELRRFKGHMSWVLSLAFSGDGRHALSGSADGTVRLWDVDTGREVRRLQGHKDQVWKAVFTAGGQHAVSCSADRTVRLWDLGSGREVCCFDKYAEPVCSVDASPDGRFVLSDGDHWGVWLWEWKRESWRALPPFRGHSDKVMAVAFSPDGRLAASGGLDRTVILWALPG
jgi:tetratricopeptide (TPR) repeat protein